MKLKIAIIVFPSTTGANDLKLACDFLEWESSFFWHKEKLNKQYDIIFIPSGLPYGEDEFSKETLLKNSPILKELYESKSLIVGISDGFRILTKLELLNGNLEKNYNSSFITGFNEFLFLDNSIYLPITTCYGNFVKGVNFNEDIILKYKNDIEISGNKIAGIFDYENKVIGMIANPELAVLSQLKNFDGRKVFEFFKNVK